MTRLMVFGAGGRAGRQIMQAAARRGIETTGAVRDLARYPDISDLHKSTAGGTGTTGSAGTGGTGTTGSAGTGTAGGTTGAGVGGGTGATEAGAGVAFVVADATDPEQVERAAQGHEVAIVATYAADLDPKAYGDAMTGLLQGLEQAGVRRLLIVGLATTLPDPAAPHRKVFEGPGFPAEWRPFSQARADELAVLERYAGPLDWAVFAPPMELVEDEGNTGYQIRHLGGPLSYTALANALLDEVAAERHHRVQVGLSGI